MSDENKEFEMGAHVAKVPVSVIENIVRTAQAAPITERCDSDCNVRNALGALGYKWAVVHGNGEGLKVSGFMEYDDCAEFVAKLYGTDVKVEYVLRNGTPRKNVKVQVKARL